jgi:hypothetical protein
VLEDRERIFGDYFRARAESGALDLEDPDLRAPAALARELERGAYLALALGHYGMGWQRTVTFGRPQETLRAAVMETLEALAKSAETIARLPDRSPEFAADQMILAAAHRRQAEAVASAGGPKDARLPVPSEFALFDSRYHYREARHRMAMAGAELNERRGARALGFLLDALEHLVFAQELARAWPVSHPNVPRGVDDEENARTMPDYLRVVLNNFDRITARS